LFVQEQRDRLAARGGELAGEPVELLGFADEAGVHDQRIEADKAPAGGLETPAVVAKDRNEGLAVLFGDGLLRARAGLGRIVADIVIAGQIATGDGQGLVQRTGKFEIVGPGRAVEGDVAGVDDEVGACRVDMIDQSHKIVDEQRQAAGQMGVGNLREAKFGHTDHSFRARYIARPFRENVGQFTVICPALRFVVTSRRRGY